MKWNHLPVGGGYYDQHPKFVDDMYTIMAVEARWRAEQDRKNKPKPNPRGRMRGSHG